MRRTALSAIAPADMGPRELMRAAALLWEKPEREFRYAAVGLLAANTRLLGPAQLPAIQRLVLADSWWDTVDGLASVVGDIVHQARDRDPGRQSVMDAWIQHGDFWVRRVAMIHQLGWRLETDTRRLFGYATALAPEKEFFIRKAIGWALRDYARWAPDAVRRFLRENRSTLSPLSLREAGKHL